MDNISQVMDLVRGAVGVVLRVGGPMLILGMLVGVLVAVFQAVTQIHEQSISFMLKLIVVVSVLMAGGGWMLETLQDYTIAIFAMIAD